MGRLMGRLWRDGVLVDHVKINDFRGRSGQFAGGLNTLQHVDLQAGLYVIELDDGRRYPVRLENSGKAQ